ncbi:hypothetical protein H206_02768 [Candidatus Electrothrix aarhusensis]|uniref:Uncharacterized protein n=1 Tax=Candidatus Electrothrix aarhusensis TaxID=1859131 RepID=A0A444IRJ9_9BACT|nr:hypothetical protein H206_02768 [Candidatus Electrothrix aarhusensis]
MPGAVLLGLFRYITARFDFVHFDPPKGRRPVVNKKEGRQLMPVPLFSFLAAGIRIRDPGLYPASLRDPKHSRDTGVYSVKIFC